MWEKWSRLVLYFKKLQIVTVEKIIINKKAMKVVNKTASY